MRGVRREYYVIACDFLPEDDESKEEEFKPPLAEEPFDETPHGR